MPRATTPVELRCLRNPSNLEQLETPWLMLMASKQLELMALSMQLFGLSLMKLITQVWVEAFAGIPSPMTPAEKWTSAPQNVSTFS